MFLSSPEPHWPQKVIVTPSAIMIYDVESPSWWKLVNHFKDGRAVKVYYRHRASGWYLVIDPFDWRRWYFSECASGVWRRTPPPFDKDATCQTGPELALPEEPHLPEAPVQTDVWACLGSSVANLSLEQQSMVYDRLVRFLELGWFSLPPSSS